MGKINVGRVVLGGIVIAVIVDLIEDVVNGAFLANWWTAAMAAQNQPPLGVTQIVLFNLWGLVTGLSAAWLCACFRPRFGAGPRAAVIAALAAWVMI